MQTIQDILFPELSEEL